MNDPAERVDKADGRNVEKHKSGVFPHCRPQLYPHFIHRDILHIYNKIFLKNF
jgi:hypothetical protein